MTSNSYPTERQRPKLSHRAAAAALLASLGGAAMLLLPDESGVRALSKAPTPEWATAASAPGTTPSDPLATTPDPVDGVCNNAAPYAKMFDSKEGEVRNYERTIKELTHGRKLDLEIPPVLTMPPGSSFAHWTTGRSWPDGSAWYPNGTDVLTTGEYEGHGWVGPHGQWSKEFGSGKNVILDDGDYAAWFGFLPNNFGHVLHENLPRVAYLREMLHPRTKFLLPDTEMFRKLVAFVDPTFAAERVVWYQENDVMTVEGGTLSLCMVSPNSQIGSGRYNHLLLPYLRRWVAESHPRTDVPAEPERRTVLYTPRAGSTVRRVVEEAHEQDILAAIRRAMDRYGVPGEIELFHGRNQATGEIMPMEEQMAYYRRAKYVIGPHGSAMANILWSDPHPPSCEDRVRMLEFIPGRYSAKVQHIYNGYYWVLGGMPVDWSQIVYAKNSTRKITYVNLPDLEDALDYLFGGDESKLLRSKKREEAAAKAAAAAAEE